MKIEEVVGEFKKVRTIMYNYQGDKAVYHWRMMRQMTGSIYVGEMELNKWGTKYYCVYVLWPGVNVALYMDRTNGWRTEEELTAWAANMGYSSKEMFVESIKRRIGIQDYIRIPELEMIKVVAPELESAAIESRDACKARRDMERAERKKKQEEEDAAFVAEENEMAKRILDNAVGIIKSGGVLENEKVSFFKSRYERKTMYVITELMDMYGVKPPIRTRGWIINRVNWVTIKDGRVAMVNWMRSGHARVSESFWTYMDQLVKAVNGGGDVN